MQRSDRFRSWAVAALVFLSAALLAGLAIWRSELTRVQLERTRVADLASVNAHAIERQILHALSSAYALAALIRQGNGTIADFDATARELLPLYEGATSLRLAPGGIVRQIYPLFGNEGAIGLDLLHDPERALEVRLALDTGRLTIAGPFDLAGGGFGAVGRLPVFLGEERAFWGFVMVSLRMPDALSPGRLPELESRGLSYRLWRIHPLTGEPQIIDDASTAAPTDPVHQAVDLPNATWTLSVAPLAGWSDTWGLALKSALGLVIALLLAGFGKLLIEARVQRRSLAALVAERTAQLAAREADLHRAQAVARVGSWALDLHSGRLSWSAEAGRILGLPAGARVRYRSLLARVDPQDRDALVQARKGVLRGEGHDIELRLQVMGDRRWVRARAEPVPAADGRPGRCLGTLQDITERKRAEEEIRQLAFFDPLTGLGNRRMLVDRLDAALARVALPRRLGALLFIDLDRFKSFNDRFGHDAGDSLLRQVAGRLGSCVRDQDLVARLGGDEFVVMLDDLDTDPDAALARAAQAYERLMETLAIPFQLAGQPCPVGASIGIALFGDRPESVEEVLKRADRAMYRAKPGGGNGLTPPAATARGWVKPVRSLCPRGSRKRLPEKVRSRIGAAPSHGDQPGRSGRLRKKSR